MATTIHRFHDSHVAYLVGQLMTTKTNVNIVIVHDVVEGEDCGAWAVSTDENLDIWQTSRLYSCAAWAIQQALFNALKNVQPNNPLCTIYHLANKTATRYDVDLKR